MEPFEDRKQAGEMLAEKLRGYASPDTIVLALPRGGVVVGFEIAKVLRAPLDVFLVRKIGIPWQREIAVGAIAAGGVKIFDRSRLREYHVKPWRLRQVIRQEKRELKRQAVIFQNDKPLPELRNKTVILADDGLATGSTMRAAITAVRKQEPKRIIAAAPMAPRTIHNEVREADEIVLLMTPHDFQAVGKWYRNFPDVKDEEVRELLRKAKNYEAAKQSTQDSMRRFF